MSFKPFSARTSLRKLKRITAIANKHLKDIKHIDDELIKSTFQALSAESTLGFPLALALAQEAATRSLGLSPFPVQVMAAAVLFDGVIAEMKTGEGKTLAIALAAAVAACSYKSVHIATPNPYLATRDCGSMRPFYEALGFTVGVTLPGQSTHDKKAAYACNITYGVHSELAFDYLRDNLVLNSAHRVQRGLDFVIVDEADSILIDEARTPLIISQQAKEQVDLVLIADGVVRKLDVRKDLSIDEKEKLALLTEEGFEHVGAILKQRGIISDEQDLYKPERLLLMRAIEAALRGHFLYERDKNYVIKGAEVLIVDESSGRTLAGRRWQEGVHQAIEAKEKLPIRPEAQTIAEITYQSYFGLYRHLSGLTGTALSSAKEFLDVYGRKTIDIPTNLPCIRNDLPDLLFANREEKFKAIVEEVHERHSRGQPVLIGTGSVAESEAVSEWLKWANLPHNVLNARQNANEAQIIAEAGFPGAITVATNMAGRGTDIALGGHKDSSAKWAERHCEVLKSGGLHVLGTQRHESRRIDDQLRGRAGRQGDPGSSQFFLSLDDDLIRIFGVRYFENLGKLLGKENGTGVTSPVLAKIIRKAQGALEERNFSAREQLFRFDGVIARQRELVYALRNSIMDGPEGVSTLTHIFRSVLSELIESYSDSTTVQLAPIKEALLGLYNLDIAAIEANQDEQLAVGALKEQLLDDSLRALVSRHIGEGPELSEYQKRVILTSIDSAWCDHLTHLDSLREGIHLRSMAQESPVHAFAIEAFKAFEAFIQRYQSDVVLRLCSEDSESSPNTSLGTPRLSRLTHCLCGSGIRYKHCHGRLPGNPSMVQTVRPATTYRLDKPLVLRSASSEVV